MNAFSRKAQKAATRERILEAARTSFETLGYEATSVRAVARAAGTAAGTVLLHFADKRDLLNAALHDELAATVHKALHLRGKGPLERDLAALARLFYAHYQRRPLLSRTMLKEALLASSPWAERYALQVAQVQAKVVELVEQARARGELAAGASAQLIGAAFFSFYYFALIAWVQGAHPQPLSLVEHLIRQHLEGSRPCVTTSS